MIQHPFKYLNVCPIAVGREQEDPLDTKLKIAYEGSAAFKSGIPRNKNPYKRLNNRFSWDWGWYLAKSSIIER